MKTGVLAIAHPRPGAQAYLESITPDSGFPPKVSEVFDRLVVNPKRGFWDPYLKAWPVLVAVVILVRAFAPRPTALAANGSAAPYSSHGAHPFAARRRWASLDG